MKPLPAQQTAAELHRPPAHSAGAQIPAPALPLPCPKIRPLFFRQPVPPRRTALLQPAPPVFPAAPAPQQLRLSLPPVRSYSQKYLLLAPPPCPVQPVLPALSPLVPAQQIRQKSQSLPVPIFGGEAAVPGCFSAAVPLVFAVSFFWLAKQIVPYPLPIHFLP